MAIKIIKCVYCFVFSGLVVQQQSNYPTGIIHQYLSIYFSRTKIKIKKKQEIIINSFEAKSICVVVLFKMGLFSLIFLT